MTKSLHPVAVVVTLCPEVGRMLLPDSAHEPEVTT
jgi:hypothetical protein